MKIKKIAKFVSAGLLAAGVAVSAANAGPIEDRQAAMKDVGGAMKALAAIAKKEAAFDAAVVKEKASLIAARFEAAKAMFPEGSDKGEKETWTKAEAWSDMAGFTAAMKAGIDAATALAAVTDEGKFLPGMKALGGACGDCHKKFRRPKE